MNRKHLITGGLGALVMVALMAALFSGAFAQQQDAIETQFGTIHESELPYLLRDMEFEYKQVTKDLERLDADLDRTRAEMVNSYYRCEAIEDAQYAHETLAQFVQKFKAIKPNATGADLMGTARLYSAIRGSDRTMGVRAQIYGGTNPQTRTRTAGILTALETCRTVAQVLTATCNNYQTILREVRAHNKTFSPAAKNLYDEASKELARRCTQPQNVLHSKELTLESLAIQTNNKALIEKYLGPESVTRTLERVRKRVKFQTAVLYY